MSFLAGASSDCGPSNPMTGLLKQFQQDRSLQQDRFALDNRGESSKPGFRSQHAVNGPISDSRQFTEEFFREGVNNGRQNMFEFSELNQELESIQSKQVGWAADFIHNHPAVSQQQFEEFEKVYNQKQPLDRQIQGGNWTSEFNTFLQNGPVLTQTEKAAFDRAFDEARQETPKTWENEFTQQESWAEEFAKDEKPAVTGYDNESLARTAGMLLDSVDIDSNPKFGNSQFMKLMRQLRDNEVVIEGKEMVQNVNNLHSNGKSADWTSEFTQNVGSLPSGNMWSNEFAQKAERGWTDEFHHEQNQHQFPGDWASEFSKNRDMTTENTQGLLNKGSDTADWLEIYNRSTSHLKNSQDYEWDSMQKDWDKFRPEQGLGYRANRPEYSVYNFTINNPYLLNPGLIDERPHNDLADSILAAEAKVQLQTSDSNSWKILGMRQQENERDDAAISALRQAVRLDPSSIDAWMLLAVSYTNENCKSDAYDSLEQWIINNEKYKHLSNRNGKEAMNSENKHSYITNMFIEAARSSPGAEMDADVQVGLGVLFNVSEEFDKAIDCFKASLASRPQDYLLWNKLGATLANSRNSGGAIDAYLNALEINPNYVRARYNLAISCINLGQHREAAEHLLTALSIQRTSEGAGNQGSVMIDDHGNTINVPGGMSDNVWASLRMLMLTMNREDLVKQCDNRNLNGFRTEFEF